MSFNMESIDNKKHSSVVCESKQGGEVSMGQQINFRCEEHKTSFERLSDRQKQYIASYMRSGSPTQVAKDMGLTGSVKGVGKTLLQIAKRMGLKSVKELGAVKAIDDNGRATPRELMKLLEKQKYRCALSGIKLSPETAQLDHIVPLSEIGTNEISNLQWVDQCINKAKGTMEQNEFIRMCNQVSQWNR